MKSKKGFTLVELLVVIVILGIVTAISIPVIRNVQTSMTEKKYTAYYDSMKSSAKLYNDSYGEDMFGNNKVGVYCLKFSELESKKLIKDINIDKVSCNRENTFVRVTKLDDKYAYAPFLACGKDGGTDINFTLPEKNKVANMDDQFCGTSSEGTLEVVLADGYDEIKDPYRNNTYTKKRREARITIRSVGGINNTWLQNGRAIDLLYRWVDKEDGSHTEWEQLTFKTESREKQDQKMMNGQIIESTSEGKIYTPTGGDGPYKLEIRVDRFQDWFQNNWKASDDGNIVSFETYAVDNIKPVIDESKFKVVSTNNKYNDLKVKIPLNASDNHTSSNKLKVCVTTSSTECNPTTSYEEPVPYTISGSYDGKEKTLTVYVKDLAGNVTNKSIKYKVAIKHTLKYDSDEGSACTNKSIIHNVNDGTKWGDLCTPSKTGYKFAGWYNGNTKVTKDTVVTGDLNVKAKWNRNAVYITYNMNGGSLSSSHGSEISYSGSTITKFYDGKWQTLYTTIEYGKKLEYDSSNGKWGLGDYNNSSYINIVKTGYSVPSGAEWINTANNKTYNQNAAYNGTDFCDASKDNCYVDLKVNWKINSYTLRYDDNGGSGCSSKSITKNYNEAWGSLCTPTRPHYTFTGWTGCGDVATSNCTKVASWKGDTGWVFVNKNTSTSIQDQQWAYYQDGVRIQSGRHYLPCCGAGSVHYYYYFVNGIAHDGWLEESPNVWTYYTHEDLPGSNGLRNGSKDCRQLISECRWVKPENACYCFDKDGHSEGRWDGWCDYY